MNTKRYLFYAYLVAVGLIGGNIHAVNVTLKGEKRIPITQQDLKALGEISITVGNMIEDMTDKKPADLTDQDFKHLVAQSFELPLPTIPIEDFNFIRGHIQLLQELVKTKKEDDYKKLLGELNPLTDEQLASLISSANFLDIEVLLNAAEAVFADRVFNPKNINSLFSNKEAYEAFMKKYTFPPDISEAIAQKKSAEIRSYLQEKYLEKVKVIAFKELKGHTRSINSVAWSPDGNSLATGSLDGTARIWDAKTGKQIHELKGHIEEVESVAWSPDGNYLATGSLDKTARIWDAKTGKQIHELKGHTGFVNSVAWSPDGNYLATGSWDNTAGIWKIMDPAIASAIKELTLPQALLLMYMRNNNIMKISDLSEYLQTLFGTLLPKEIQELF